MTTILKKNLPQKNLPLKKNLKTPDSNPFKRSSYHWQAGAYDISLGIQTQVMGIINVTPDSFSQDGILSEKDTQKAALEQAKTMLDAGVTILDIGGESSRPGAGKVTLEEEVSRVLPVLEKLVAETQIPISVDTYKPEVAEASLEAGASIINNIRGAQLDLRFVELAKKHKAGLVLMHMFGSPENMQENYTYDDCVLEIKQELQESLNLCLANGLSANQVVLDPGIGFGKSVEHNLQIMNRLADFADLNQPILIGSSRKSFIGHVLEKDVDKRLYGSVATACAAVLRGAHIIRVHDVQATQEAVQMVDAVMNEGIL